jgi:hypothetical protein
MTKPRTRARDGVWRLGGVDRWRNWIEGVGTKKILEEMEEKMKKLRMEMGRRRREGEGERVKTLGL